MKNGHEVVVSSQRWPWTHPNTGLNLDGSDVFSTLFAEIIRHLLQTGGKHDLGCDECLIINHLWTFHRSAIRFLPRDFNINLHQTPAWASNPVMQSYIYHFVGQSKKYLDQCRWQRTNPPDLPYFWDTKASTQINRFGDAPPRISGAASCLHSDTIANLLAVYPEMQIQINQRSEQYPCPPDEVKNSYRDQQFAATYTSYFNLPKLLVRVGPNASRISIASHDSLPKSKILSNSLPL